MRRLLGPIGGPFTFFLVAALVFAGLGWVTIAALRVEDAQREAAAQAELGNNLRVALWRLDGRMLPALGVEDSRPFYHYSSADPLSGSTAGPTPLLAAPLPDWMKLHVQLDPTTGWESPQVLAPLATERVSQAWPDLPLRNNTAERAAVLELLKDKYASRSTWELLAARDRAIPSDALPLAAPLFDSQGNVDGPAVVGPPVSPGKPPPPPEMGPISSPPAKSPDTFRFFGWEFSRRDAVTNNFSKDSQRQDMNDNMLQPPDAVQQQQAGIAKPPAFPPNAPPPGGAVGRAPFPPTNLNERQSLEYFNRAKTIQRAMQESKNAGQDYPLYGKAYPQNTILPANPQGNGMNQLRNGTNQLPMLPVPGAGNDRNEKDKDGKFKNTTLTGSDLEKAKKADANKDEKAGGKAEYLQTEQLRGTLFEHLATLSLGLERLRCLDEIQQALDDNKKQLADLGNGNPAVSPNNPGARLVPPAEERPLMNLQGQNNPQLNNSLVGPPTVNIHVGSMRPQWIVAPDGTEMLVLVRAANIDGKTIYQGVVLDWPKLEQLLKDEVKDLFPEASLVPVKDSAGVSPDRAMTALPVQLDPGPSAPPPSPRWTPLRMGLVLAWVAALVAFAAVGFCGWSLIDLAERRIRFVSAVTHELRTPLTSLRIYLDLLMSGMIHDEAKRQEYLKTLATESDRLHRLIDNVLDFAKLEKRAKNGDMKPIRVGELLDQLRSTWTDRVGADGKELIVISTLPAETEVATDAAMVHQIVGNLIDNARKYTRDAEDKRIWLWAKPGGNGRVVFEVEDRGAGVPANERKTIFKPFRRGTQADTKAGGAGLGLALAKQWAEVLGGTVAYRPADGAPGACFRLELPGK